MTSRRAEANDGMRVLAPSQVAADPEDNLQPSARCELVGVDVAAIALEADALYEALMARTFSND
jgi:hypothetical protein